MASETKTPFQRAVAEFAGAWETEKRDSGETFYRVKDRAAHAWVTEAVKAAHFAIDGRLPDDWIYEHAARIADVMTGYGADDADGMRENDHEICDGLVDIYNSERSRWLASHGGNPALCDEACEELGVERADTMERIGYGQFLALTRIFNAVIEACDERAGDLVDEMVAEEMDHADDPPLSDEPRG